MRKIISIVGLIYSYEVSVVNPITSVTESATQTEVRTVFKFRKSDFSGYLGLIFFIAFAFYRVRVSKNGVFSKFNVVGRFYIGVVFAVIVGNEPVETRRSRRRVAYLARHEIVAVRYRAAFFYFKRSYIRARAAHSRKTYIAFRKRAGEFNNFG